MESVDENTIGGKTMSWHDIDDLKKILRDREFVSCDEEYEKEHVADQLAKKYVIPKETAKQIVEKCCQKVPAPRNREKFMDCLYLEILKYFGRG